MKHAPLALALMSAAFAPTMAWSKTDWAKTGLKPDMAYVLVQIEPVEFHMMGNNQVVTGIFLAPYDVDASRIQIASEEGKPLRIARVVVKGDAVAKDGKRRQYFMALAPGNWVIEGAGGDVPLAGTPLTSYALGSYRFEAKAGQVVDLGVLTPGRDASDNPDTKLTTGKMFGMVLAGPFGGGRIEALPLNLDMRARGSGDLPLPAWVPADRLVKPDMVYGATFANLLGGLVNRIDGKAGRNRALISKAAQSDVPSAEEPKAP